MKTKLILAILLISIAGLLFAREDPARRDEMQRKDEELKALSDRFKVEQGFDGVIETNAEVMKLSHFRGNFKDIDMSVVRDSVAFRQVCNRIISKLLPYIAAKENQLDAGKISISSTNIRTQYRQRVNGYPMEGTGRLVVSYEKDYNRLSMLNVTAKTDNNPAIVKVPLDKAIETARRELGLDSSEKPYNPRIAYVRNPTLSEGVCSLCYIITFATNTVYIDPENGNVRFTLENRIIY